MKKVAIGGLALAGVLIVGALLVALFGSPLHTSVPLGSLSLVSPARIEISATCGVDEVALVEESEESVVIELRVKVRPGDCASGATVELSEPLGQREVIDATTGDRVEVAGASGDG